MRGNGSGTTEAIRPIADRPMGVIDLLDGSFSIVRHQPKVVLGLVAVLVVPLALFEGLFLRRALGDVGLLEMLDDPALAEDAMQPVGDSYLFLGYLVDWMTVSLVGLLVAVVVGDWFEGREPTVTSVLRRVAPRLPVWVGAFVAIHLAELIGTVLLVIPGMIAVVGFSLTSPVLAVEGLGPIASMRRSMQLVRRNPGPVIGLILLTAIVGVPVEYAISLLPVMAVTVFGAGGTWPLVSAASLLSSLVILPVTAGSMALAYFDLRFRTEGLDLERRRANLVARA